MNNNNFTSLNIAPYTFKIPLNNVVNNIVYYNETAEHQTVYFNDNSYKLDKLNIMIYDRIGAQLTGFNNWTLTLLIEYDDDNYSKTEFLNLELLNKWNDDNIN